MALTSLPLFLCVCACHLCSPLSWEGLSISESSEGIVCKLWNDIKGLSSPIPSLVCGLILWLGSSLVSSSFCFSQVVIFLQPQFFLSHFLCILQGPVLYFVCPLDLSNVCQEWNFMSISVYSGLNLSVQCVFPAFSSFWEVNDESSSTQPGFLYVSKLKTLYS